MVSFTCQEDNYYNYYEVDGFKYTGMFPYEWANDHKCLSGPKHCNNCRAYGSINGVFVMYCLTCVENVYNNILYPTRNTWPSLCMACKDILSDEELWDCAPYMRGIPMSRIGIPNYSGQVQDLFEDDEVFEDNAIHYPQQEHS
jgi:hypothetical protein